MVLDMALIWVYMSLICIDYYLTYAVNKQTHKRTYKHMSTRKRLATIIKLARKNLLALYCMYWASADWYGCTKIFIRFALHTNITDSLHRSLYISLIIFWIITPHYLMLHWFEIRNWSCKVSNSAHLKDTSR